MKTLHNQTFPARSTSVCTTWASAPERWPIASSVSSSQLSLLCELRRRILTDSPPPCPDYGWKPVQSAWHCFVPGPIPDAVHARLGAWIYDDHRPLQRRASLDREHRHGIPQRGLLRPRGQGVSQRRHARGEVNVLLSLHGLLLSDIASSSAPSFVRSRSICRSRLGSCGALIDVPVGTVVAPKASIAVTRNYDFDFVHGKSEEQPYRTSKPVCVCS